MVVLEAAALTAGGFAAYKGGKAAVTATAKSVKTKLKLSDQEKGRKETYDSRKQERKDRFAEINKYRSSLRDMNGGSNSNSNSVKTRGEGLVHSFNWSKSDSTKSKSSGASASSRASSASRSYSTPNKSSSRSWFDKK